MKFFGCLYEKAVLCLEKSYSDDKAIPWYQFGKLSEDLKIFYVDKIVIFETIKIFTSKEACVLCPYFSWERIENAVNSLPDEIDMTQKRYRIKFSRFDPLKPIGIEKENRYGVLHGLPDPGIER